MTGQRLFASAIEKYSSRETVDREARGGELPRWAPRDSRRSLGAGRGFTRGRGRLTVSTTNPFGGSSRTKGARIDARAPARSLSRQRSSRKGTAQTPLRLLSVPAMGGAPETARVRGRGYSRDRRAQSRTCCGCCASCPSGDGAHRWRTATGRRRRTPRGGELLGLVRRAQPADEASIDAGERVGLAARAPESRPPRAARAGPRAHTFTIVARVQLSTAVVHRCATKERESVRSRARLYSIGGRSRRHRQRGRRVGRFRGLLNPRFPAPSAREIFHSLHLVIPRVRESG